MTQERWRTAEGRELDVSDMSLSHIQSAVLLLHKRASEARQFADACQDLKLEKKADQQLESAQKWFRRFAEEMTRRASEGIINNDPRLTEQDILDMMPEDLEQFLAEQPR